MPKSKYCLCLALGFLILAGCDSISTESIYEGIRSSERAKSGGTGQSDKALPSYDQYSKERESIKK